MIDKTFQEQSADQATNERMHLEATDRLLKDAEGAAILGCSKATWWRRVADGTLPPAIKIGGTSRWLQSEILAAIARAAAQRDR